MIVLPKHIVKVVHSVSKNTVRRCYGYEEILLDNANGESIISRNPFVVEQGGRRIMFTSNFNNPIPVDIPYAVLVNKKPTASLFRNGELNVISWLKHPAINDMLTPDEVSHSWRGKFTFVQEDRDAGLYGLRQPQADAIHAWLASRHSRKDRAIIVMPTGTGKTETMLGIMVAGQCRKTLVTVPSDALRDQLSAKFITLGKLHALGIVSEDCKNPYVSVIDSGIDSVEGWQGIIEHSNVIVTTMAILIKTSERIRLLLHSSITNVFVDEAHHSEAPLWREFLDGFNRVAITQFTATPFRNDGRKMKGDFVFTFSLRAAQQQGYYERINFCPIYEIEKSNGDQKIAERAVQILREDRDVKHKNHILMARCKDTARAEQVFELYKDYVDLNPVVIHSKTLQKGKILEEIKRGEHKIIVCVNMLGEGFDLPQLKVAAIHDEKQSLPITLQFIGRFTRTADNSIGEASFVTNMAYPPMADEIRDLYLKDADWNIIIPGLNDRTTEEQRAFTELLNNFPGLNEAEIPFQSINPALSTVIYTLDHFEWDTTKWEHIFSERDYDYRYCDVNTADDMMIIILGSIEGVDWTNFEGIQNRVWNVILLHKYDAGHYKHLYINSSLHGMSFDKLVEALFGNKQVMLDGENMFRSFHDLRRILVQTFGGRKAIAGDISFKSYVGRDVENGLSEVSQGRLAQNNIFASGIYQGERITHGCSRSGKVWSYRRGNLLSFQDWSHRIGSMIEDPTIDPHELFKHTLRVHPTATLPSRSVPVGVDWDDDVYKNAEIEQMLSFEGCNEEAYIFDTKIEITQQVWDLEHLPTHTILFTLSYKTFIAEYRITYSSVEDGEFTRYTYMVEHVSGCRVGFRRRQISFGDITEYFNSEKRSPVFFFANGAMLYANNMVELKDEAITPLLQDELVAWNWNGVDLSVESMDWPHKQNSIQYYVWKKIEDSYELVFDDDGSGEVADLIGINQDANSIYLDLYHLKFAHDGHTSRRIDNFYEVCGQAQKSLKWKNVEMNIFHRLIRRATNTAKGTNRILKGDMALLQQLSQDAAYTKKIKMNLNIVQPGLSKVDAQGDVLQILGVVKNYAFEVCNAELKVYCSQ